MRPRLATLDIRRKKELKEPLVALTAYDYPSAVAADAAGVDVILVGDSLASVVLGHPNTLPVTMDEMVHHAKAVVRGAHRALVVGDLPFLADATPEAALLNAGRLLKEAGVGAVKLEGGHPPQLACVEALVQHGVPVVGHLGFTPQHVHLLGGFRMQGKTEAAARQLEEQALALEAAGCFALVLELVPEELAARVSARLAVPTIGIGAGNRCDGQIQVFHDLLGLHVDYVPKHARRYAQAHQIFLEAISRYASEVRGGSFGDQALSAIDRQEGKT